MATLDSFINPKPEASSSDNSKPVPSKPKKPRAPPILPWTKKYLPSTLDDFVASDSLKKKLLNFINNFDSEKKKALLLWGPNGVGKSCVAKTLSDDLDLEFIELNASDKRNKAVIEEQLGNILNQGSLFGGSKLVLVDDLDGVSGQKDRGGASAIAKLVPKSKFPILITCLNPYSDKLKPVRSKCQLVELPLVSESAIISKLSFILSKEEISYEDSDLALIAKSSAGDLRAAINDCQMLSIGKKKLDTTFLKDLTSRLHSTDMKEAIAQVLKADSAKDALHAFDRLNNGDLDKAALWLDYNMPLEYTSKLDRARAYGCLTKADVFKSRIMRRQHWRFLVYVNAMLTAGIATAKSKPYTSNIPYKDSSRILIMWQANMKYGKRKAIAEKIAKRIHTSKKRTIKDFEFYAKMVAHSDALAKDFDLDSDEVAFCKKILA